MDSVFSESTRRELVALSRAGAPPRGILREVAKVIGEPGVVVLQDEGGDVTERAVSAVLAFAAAEGLALERAAALILERARERQAAPREESTALSDADRSVVARVGLDPDKMVARESGRSGGAA